MAYHYFYYHENTPWTKKTSTRIARTTSVVVISPRCTIGKDLSKNTKQKQILNLSRGDPPQGKLGKIQKIRKNRKNRKNVVFRIFLLFCSIFCIFPIFPCGGSPRPNPERSLNMRLTPALSLQLYVRYPDWLIRYLRFFGRSFREVFWRFP